MRKTIYNKVCTWFLIVVMVLTTFAPLRPFAEESQTTPEIQTESPQDS